MQGAVAREEIELSFKRYILEKTEAFAHEPMEDVYRVNLLGQMLDRYDELRQKGLSGDAALQRTTADYADIPARMRREGFEEAGAHRTEARWPQMTEEEAAASMCSRLPERLHEQAHLLVDRWDRPILPVPGMAELVRELKEAGYGVYLLSNASYRQHEYWPRVPGSEYFDGTLISADVKLIKPCAEIYELLYSTFDLTPSECLFIDDSAPNIEGAERTGMPGIVFHGDADELRGEMKAFGVKV